MSAPITAVSTLPRLRWSTVRHGCAAARGVSQEVWLPDLDSRFGFQIRIRLGRAAFDETDLTSPIRSHSDSDWSQDQTRSGKIRATRRVMADAPTALSDPLQRWKRCRFSRTAGAQTERPSERSAIVETSRNARKRSSGRAVRLSAVAAEASGGRQGNESGRCEEEPDEGLARPRNSRNRQECRRRVIRRTRLSSSRLVQKPVVGAIGQLARPASSTNTPARSGAFERVWTTVVRAMFVGRSAGKGEVPAVGRPAASTDSRVSNRGRVAGAHSEGGRADLVRRETRVRHPEW